MLLFTLIGKAVCNFFCFVRVQIFRRFRGKKIFGETMLPFVSLQVPCAAFLQPRTLLPFQNAARSLRWQVQRIATEPIPHGRISDRSWSPPCTALWRDTPPTNTRPPASNNFRRPSTGLSFWKGFVCPFLCFHSNIISFTAARGQQWVFQAHTPWL